MLGQSNAAAHRRIALCLEYPIELHGGVSVLCATLTKALSSRFEIVIVSADTEQSFAKSAVASHVRQWIPWDPLRTSPRTAKQLAKTLQEHGVACAHFHYGGPFGFGNRLVGHSPIPYAARMGIATCSTVHLGLGPLEGYCGPEKPSWFKLAVWPIAWTGKFHTLLHLQREITVSRWCEEQFRRRYFPVRNRFQTIYHSRVFQADLSPAMEREKFVLNVGHLARRKGQWLLVQAFSDIAKHHPDWKLLLVGGNNDPQPEQELRAMIASAGMEDRIELLGARPDALEFTQRAAVFVQPSEFEGLPLSLQEALLAGCACIATDIPGNNELVQDGINGLLVPKGDRQKMAAALDRLLGDDALRGSFQAAAAPSVVSRGMSAEQMVAAHAQLYEECIAVAEGGGQGPRQRNV